MPKPTRQPRGGRPRLRLTYSNVVSTLCLFALLGGGAYAASGARLPKRSVGPRQLRKGAVTTAKLRKGAVTNAKLRDGSVSGEKIDLASLGTVPSAARAGSAARADRATMADRAADAGHAASAERAKSAAQAASAERADRAAAADDAERLGGRPASEYQLQLQQGCPSAAIEAIGQDGSVLCHEATLPISLDQGAGDPVDAVQLGTGLLLQSVCHDGAQVKVVFLNNGATTGSLNWFASVGGAASADGVAIPANGSKSFLYDGSRVEGQFIYSIGLHVTTVSLHAYDATSSCEIRGTAVLAAPPLR